MTIARAEEIRKKISAWESQTGNNFDSIQIDQEGWQAFAEEIGATVEELDEFVTVDLARAIPSNNDTDDCLDLGPVNADLMTELADGDDEDGRFHAL